MPSDFNVPPPGFKPAEAKSSLAQIVYTRLKEAIFDFSMPPGQRYAEQALAEQFQVSRTPMRLALHVLAHEGFMHNLGGHACWQVAPINLSFYEDIYDFRIEIEAIALRRACAAGIARDAVALKTLNTVWAVPKHRRETDGARVAKLDEAFHRKFVAMAENRWMLRSYDEITERIRIIRRLDFISPARIQATYEDHAAILDAVTAKDAGAAEALMRRHIETSRIEIRKITLHDMALASPPDAASF